MKSRGWHILPNPSLFSKIITQTIRSPWCFPNRPLAVSLKLTGQLCQDTAEDLQPNLDLFGLYNKGWAEANGAFTTA
jgi:hypothetical protein